MAFLQQQPGVDPNRIGAVGFCMGGGYALQLAVTDKGMKAASAFYGAAPKPLEAFAASCPIVGSYPEKDFSAEGARELDAVLEKTIFLTISNFTRIPSIPSSTSSARPLKWKLPRMPGSACYHSSVSI